MHQESAQSLTQRNTLEIRPPRDKIRHLLSEQSDHCQQWSVSVTNPRRLTRRKVVYPHSHHLKLPLNLLPVACQFQLKDSSEPTVRRPVIQIIWSTIKADRSLHVDFLADARIREGQDVHHRRTGEEQGGRIGREPEVVEDPAVPRGGAVAVLGPVAEHQGRQAPQADQAKCRPGRAVGRVQGVVDEVARERGEPVLGAVRDEVQDPITVGYIVYPPDAAAHQRRLDDGVDHH